MVDKVCCIVVVGSVGRGVVSEQTNTKLQEPQNVNLSSLVHPLDGNENQRSYLHQEQAIWGHAGFMLRHHREVKCYFGIVVRILLSCTLHLCTSDFRLMSNKARKEKSPLTRILKEIVVAIGFAATPGTSGSYNASATNIVWEQMIVLSLVSFALLQKHVFSCEIRNSRWTSHVGQIFLRGNGKSRCLHFLLLHVSQKTYLTGHATLPCHEASRCVVHSCVANVLQEKMCRLQTFAT